MASPKQQEIIKQEIFSSDLVMDLPMLKEMLNAAQNPSGGFTLSYQQMFDLLDIVTQHCSECSE